MQISCPHIEKSCTAAYYSDRKLGVSQSFGLAVGACRWHKREIGRRSLAEFANRGRRPPKAESTGILEGRET